MINFLNPQNRLITDTETRFHALRESPLQTLLPLPFPLSLSERLMPLFKSLLDRGILDPLGKICSPYNELPLPPLRPSQIQKIQQVFAAPFWISFGEKEGFSVSTNQLLFHLTRFQKAKGFVLNHFQLCGSAVFYFLFSDPSYIQEIFTSLKIEPPDPSLFQAFLSPPVDYDLRMEWGPQTPVSQDALYLQSDLLSSILEDYIQNTYPGVVLHSEFLLELKTLCTQVFKGIHIVDNATNFFLCEFKNSNIDLVFYHSLPRLFIFRHEALFVSLKLHNGQLVPEETPISPKGISPLQAFFDAFFHILHHSHLQSRIEAIDWFRYCHLKTKGNISSQLHLEAQLFPFMQERWGKEEDLLFKHFTHWIEKHIPSTTLPNICLQLFFLFNTAQQLKKHGFPDQTLFNLFHSQLSPLKLIIQQLPCSTLQALYTLLIEDLPVETLPAFLQLIALLIPSKSSDSDPVSVDWLKEGEFEKTPTLLHVTLYGAHLILELDPLRALQTLIDSQHKYPALWQKNEPHLMSLLLSLLSKSTLPPQTHGEWLKEAQIDTSLWQEKTQQLLTCPTRAFQLLALLTLRTFPHYNCLPLGKEAASFCLTHFLTLSNDVRPLLVHQLQRFLEPSLLPEDPCKLESWLSHLLQKKAFETAYQLWKSHKAPSLAFETTFNLLSQLAYGRAHLATQMLLHIKEDPNVYSLWIKSLKEHPDTMAPFIHTYWQKTSPSFATSQGQDAALLMQQLLHLLPLLLTKQTNSRLSQTLQLPLSLLDSYLSWSEERKNFTIAYRLAHLATLFPHLSEEQKTAYHQRLHLSYWRQHHRKAEEETPFLTQILKSTSDPCQLISFLATNCQLQPTVWSKFLLILFHQPQFLIYYTHYKNLYPEQCDQTIFSGMLTLCKAEHPDPLTFFCLSLTHTTFTQQGSSEIDRDTLFPALSLQNETFLPHLKQLLTERKLPYTYLQAFLQMLALILHKDTDTPHSYLCLSFSSRHHLFLPLNSPFTSLIDLAQTSFWETIENTLYSLFLAFTPSIGTQYRASFLEKISLPEEKLLQMLDTQPPLLQLMGLLVLARLPVKRPLIPYIDRLGLPILLSLPSHKQSYIHSQLEQIAESIYPLGSTQEESITNWLEEILPRDQETCYTLWEHFFSSHPKPGAFTLPLLQNQGCSYPLFSSKLLACFLATPPLSAFSKQELCQLLEWSKQLTLKLKQATAEEMLLCKQAAQLFNQLLTYKESLYKKEHLPKYPHYLFYIECEPDSKTLRELIEKTKSQTKTTSSQRAYLERLLIIDGLKTAHSQEEKKQQLLQAQNSYYSKPFVEVEEALADYIVSYGWEGELFSLLTTWFISKSRSSGKDQCLCKQTQVMTYLLNHPPQDLMPVLSLLELLSDCQVEALLDDLVSFLQTQNQVPLTSGLKTWLETTCFFRKLPSSLREKLASVVGSLVYHAWQASAHALIDKYPETCRHFTLSDWHNHFLECTAMSWKNRYQIFLRYNPYTPENQETYINFHRQLLQRVLENKDAQRVLLLLEQLDPNQICYKDLLNPRESQLENESPWLFELVKKTPALQTQLFYLLLELDPHLEILVLTKESGHEMHNLYHKWLRKGLQSNWPLACLEKLHQELYHWLGQLLSEEKNAILYSKQVLSDYRYLRFLMESHKEKETQSKKVIEERIAKMKEPVYWTQAGQLISFIGEKNIVFLGLLWEPLKSFAMNHRSLLCVGLDYQLLLRNIRLHLDNSPFFSAELFNLTLLLYDWMYVFHQGLMFENGESILAIIHAAHQESCRDHTRIVDLMLFIRIICVTAVEAPQIVAAIFGNKWISVCCQTYISCLNYLTLNPSLSNELLSNLTQTYQILCDYKELKQDKRSKLLFLLPDLFSILVNNWEQIKADKNPDVLRSASKAWMYLMDLYAEISSSEGSANHKLKLLTGDLLPFCESSYQLLFWALDMLQEDGFQRSFLLLFYDKLVLLLASPNEYADPQSKVRFQKLLADGLHLMNTIKPKLLGRAIELHIHTQILSLLGELLLNEAFSNQHATYSKLFCKWLLDAPSLLMRAETHLQYYKATEFSQEYGKIFMTLVKLVLESEAFYNEIPFNSLYENWIAIYAKGLKKLKRSQEYLDVSRVFYFHLKSLREYFKLNLPLNLQIESSTLGLAECRKWILLSLKSLLSHVGDSEVRLFIKTLVCIELEYQDQEEETVQELQKAVQVVIQGLKDPLCLSHRNGILECADLIHFYCAQTTTFLFKPELEAVLRQILLSMRALLQKDLAFLPEETAAERILNCLECGTYIAAAFSQKSPKNPWVEALLKELLGYLPRLIDIQSLHNKISFFCARIGTKEMCLEAKYHLRVFCFSEDDYFFVTKYIEKLFVSTTSITRAFWQALNNKKS